MKSNRNRFLQIVFDQQVQSYEIPYFRAAIIEKTKRESTLFHNHVDSDSFIYRYPLIQYKIKDRKPCLICLNEATDDIHYLLREKNFDFQIGKSKIDFSIEDVRLKYETVQTWDMDFKYNIHHWIALNQDNFKSYQKFTRLVDKIQFLEDILGKHLRIFMEAMEAPEPIALKLQIDELKGEKYIEYKDVFHLTFSLNFTTNLSIPNFVGLGKGVSIGFGNVKRLGREFSEE